jgi:glycosyltransferase involved in cell wall biosynthesis
MFYKHVRLSKPGASEKRVMREDQLVRVSVVVPTFQEGRYVGGLLSKLSKAGPNFEAIVVDGGSTDDTVKVAEQFTDKVYVINQRGIAVAKNFGARKSRGEIIVFLDTDVSPPPDFVDKTLGAFRDRRVAGATCNIMPLNPRVSEFVFFKFYNKLLQFMTRFKPHSRGEFLAVRKEAFVKVGGFDERLPCIEDHDFALRVSKLGKFCFISDLCVYESMRRIRKSGLLNVLRTWIVDYVSYVLFRRTVSKVWVPVR